MIFDWFKGKKGEVSFEKFKLLLDAVSKSVWKDFELFADGKLSEYEFNKLLPLRQQLYDCFKVFYDSMKKENLDLYVLTSEDENPVFLAGVREIAETIWGVLNKLQAISSNNVEQFLDEATRLLNDLKLDDFTAFLSAFYNQAKGSLAYMYEPGLPHSVKASDFEGKIGSLGKVDRKKGKGDHFLVEFPARFGFTVGPSEKNTKAILPNTLKEALKRIDAPLRDAVQRKRISIPYDIFYAYLLCYLCKADKDFSKLFIKKYACVFQP